MLRAACETKSCQGDKGVAERRRATAVEKLLIGRLGSAEAAVTWYGQECGWEDSIGMLLEHELDPLIIWMIGWLGSTLMAASGKESSEHMRA